MIHHELWGDEIHSWNIAKGSESFFDLLSNTRYEGHPPLWYIILWMISKFTHDPFAIQVVHLAIAWLIIFLILFFSPFPLFIRSLIPFGYYFLFEYSIISRNYSIGILLALMICIILFKNFKGKLFLYYLLLLLLSNSQLLSLLLAASLHFYFLLLKKEKATNTKPLFYHFVAGVVIFLPSVYFIFPPPDSALSTNYWLSRWNTDHLSALVQSPVRSLIPIPDWTQYHFWDTQFLITKGHFYSLPGWCIFLISTGLVILAVSLLRSDKKCLYFLLFNLLLIAMVSFIIPFTNARHVGFIYTGLLIALWLYCSQHSLDKVQKQILFIFLLLQLPGSIIAISRDIRHPFSNGYRINELVKNLPEEKIVADYWCLNKLAAFTDKSYYCIETQKKQSYLLWNSELDSALDKTDRYSTSVGDYMKKQMIKNVYLFSTQRLEKLQRLDGKLFSMFNVSVVDKREGAIEKGGNLYLYEITYK